MPFPSHPPILGCRQWLPFLSILVHAVFLPTEPSYAESECINVSLNQPPYQMKGGSPTSHTHDRPFPYQFHTHKVSRVARFGDIMLICVFCTQDMSETEKETQREAQTEKRERPKQEDLFLGPCTHTSVSSFCLQRLSG